MTGRFWIITAIIAILLGVFFINMQDTPKIYEICDDQNIAPKQEILSAIQNEPDEIKALVLAVASLETEHFTVNYPTCDNKASTACNIGIFKINLALLDKILGTESDPELQNQIHHNRTVATNIFVQGLKKFDHIHMLKLHRGGEGWQNYRQDIIDDYISAVTDLQDKWLENPSELSTDTTSCKRYTIDVMGI